MSRQGDPGKGMNFGKHKRCSGRCPGELGLGLPKAKGLGLIALEAPGSFKLLYFFKSFFSMFLMIGLYTLTFGWVHAVTVVGLILIHEMGHCVFIKAMNIVPTLPDTNRQVQFLSWTRLEIKLGWYSSHRQRAAAFV